MVRLHLGLSSANLYFFIHPILQSGHLTIFSSCLTLLWEPLLENADSQSIFTRSASAVIPSKKSSVITNRKFTMHFPMSLRWTVYIICKSPKGGIKTQNGRFLSESALLWKKVYCKLPLCENCHWQVVRHSLADLSVQIWLLVDVTFYLKFQPKPTRPPFKNAKFWSIFACSTSAFSSNM